MINFSFNYKAWFCLFIGILIISIGVMINEIKFGLFIIFPYFIGSGIFAFLGVILIFLSMIFFFFHSSSHYKYNFQNYNEKSVDNIDKEKQKIKAGGVILIGPLPIIFGTNWKITAILGIIAILLSLTFLLLLPNYL